MSDDVQAVTGKKTVAEPTRRMEELPQYRVILLNDEVNEFGDVVRRVCELTPLSKKDAIERTTEAHKIGHSLLLMTHKERAELFQQQFASLRPPIEIGVEPVTA